MHVRLQGNLTKALSWSFDCNVIHAELFRLYKFYYKVKIAADNTEITVGACASLKIGSVRLASSHAVARVAIAGDPCSSSNGLQSFDSESDSSSGREERTVVSLLARLKSPKSSRHSTIEEDQGERASSWKAQV